MKTCTIILEIVSTLINFRWTVVRFLFRFSFSQIFRHVISNLNHIFKLPKFFFLTLVAKFTDQFKIETG